MSGKVFLSHSSKDKPLVMQIAEHLDRSKVWVDAWDLEQGTLLPQEIASGLDGAGYFVLIASKASMASNWVRYELNLALIRWIEERNISLCIIKIDDCTLHPELRPFLYRDCSKDPASAINIVSQLVREGVQTTDRNTESTKERVINRFKELQALEDLANEGFKAVVLWGLYGIGKTALMEKAAKTVFQRSIERFALSESHGAMRLAFEMCARASLPLPNPTGSDHDFIKACADATQRMSSLGKLLLFDDVENALDDDNQFKPFFRSVLEALPAADKLPVLLCSTKSPGIPGELAGQVHIMRIHPLEEKHMVFCLDRWVRLADPSQQPPTQEQLQAVAKHLDGYPLAAKLAAPLVATYGAEKIITDLRHLTNLKIDMAKQLIGRSRSNLSELETNILEVLTVDDSGVTAEEIAAALAIEPDQVRRGIDKLTRAALVKHEGAFLGCHPLIRDYVWQRAYDSGNWKKIAFGLGVRAKQELEILSKSENPDNIRFVQLCTKAYRLLVMAGEMTEANKLTIRFKDEIRGAGHRLYHAKQYSMAYSFLDLWVDANPHDDDTRILRARCLTRLKRYSEAWDDINILEKHNFPMFRIYHARGLWYRDQDRFREAAEEFRKGRDLKGNYLPLLRDLGDMLARAGELEEAKAVLETAYGMAANDRFVVPKYADVLERCGDLEKALTIATRAARAFPDEASFQHRVAVLLAKADRYPEALEYARRAADLDPSAAEHVLHCASVEVRQGYPESAEKRLSELPELQGRPLRVKHTVLAGIALSRNNTGEARRLLARYQPDDDHYVAELVGRICMAEATALVQEGKYGQAKERLDSARAILSSSKWSGNRVVENTLLRVEAFRERMSQWR